MKAARLFQPCGLVPPGIAGHSVNILRFKINHSQLDERRKTHTCVQANEHTYTQHVTSNVFCPYSINKAASACLIACHCDVIGSLYRARRHYIINIHINKYIYSHLYTQDNSSFYFCSTVNTAQVLLISNMFCNCTTVINY